MLGSFSYFPVYQHFPRCLLESSNWVLAFSQVLPGDSDYLLLILLWPQTVGLRSGQYYIWFKWHFQMTFPLLLCRNHSQLRLMSSRYTIFYPFLPLSVSNPRIYPFIWWGFVTQITVFISAQVQLFWMIHPTSWSFPSLLFFTSLTPPPHYLSHSLSKLHVRTCHVPSLISNPLTALCPQVFTPPNLSFSYPNHIHSLI